MPQSAYVREWRAHLRDGGVGKAVEPAWKACVDMLETVRATRGETLASFRVLVWAAKGVQGGTTSQTDI